MADNVLLMSSYELIQNIVWISNKIRRDKNDTFLSESIYKCGMKIGFDIYRENSCKNVAKSVEYLKNVIESCTELEFLVDIANKVGYILDAKYNFILENISFVKKKAKMSLGVDND